MAAVRRKRDPELPARVHVIGACGRALGGLALELRARGVAVSASDGYSYLGMRETLAAGGIDCRPTYAEENLGEVDLVLSGSMIRRDNPELLAARRRGIPVLNFAEFLGRGALRTARNWVVAGTNGKSTTTSILVDLVRAAGRCPDYLIGGLPVSGEPAVRLRGAGEFVIEGDEYQVGVTNLNPKFLEYHPRVLVLTNLSLDHTDIYPTWQAYRRPFVALLDRLVPDGLLVVNGDDPGLADLLEEKNLPLRIVRVGFGRGNDRRITRLSHHRDGVGFDFAGRSWQLPLAGRMNALNAALALAAVIEAEAAAPETLAEALAGCRGVRGRNEQIQAGPGLWHYDDEGYHPGSVQATLRALRDRHSRQRLVSFFQPRGGTGVRGELERGVIDGLAIADRVVLTWATPVAASSGQKAFRTAVMIRQLRERGVEASFVKDAAQLAAAARRWLQPGDVVHTALAKRTLAEEAELFRALEQLNRDWS